MLLAGTAAFAQETAPTTPEKPAMDIPVYPGGEATMEVNLSNEDILPMLKAMLPLLGPKFASLTDSISPEDLAAVFKDVRRIQFLQVDVAKPGAADKDVADYYAKNLPKGNWNRVFWQSGTPMGTVAIYAAPGAEMLYAFRVRTVKQEDATFRQAQVLKTEGQVDYMKLLTIAAKYAAGTASTPAK